ncbi:carbohydrate binding domain-containing protein [Photorhabdus temperata]|uniref:Putative carbohydrate binding protein n=1 Tax=Photorhabdus temperata subsp. temperata Meg1 TaxID=1393735 RepID=A0A081RUM3_PHOTE|nr:carbohydrate binding domain-containing protein [Photorhabdus temperata]KER02376.1 putative carbohydrate binding protein [Photorhabdus temperata subsp. temperata Meg1]MCT8348235.1 carbohydrate binding domain-containing protein [Photorhabdus temperata]
MDMKKVLNNEDYSDTKNANKELINGSFNEGYHGWKTPTSEAVEILSENGANFLRIQSYSDSGIIDQIIKGLEPNVKYRLTGTARLSTKKTPQRALPAYFGLQNSTSGPESFIVDSFNFTTGSVELSTDEKGFLRVYMMKDQFVGFPEEATADFTGFILEKA